MRNFHDAIAHPAPIDYSVDIEVVITIDKLKIGIKSKGDPNSGLTESLENFASQNCDIIICATRSRGDTVDVMTEMYNKYHYDIIWATNYRSHQKNQDILNHLSAENIFELTKSLMI